MEIVVEKKKEEKSGEHQFFHSYLLSSKCERREYKDEDVYNLAPIPWKDGNFDRNGFVKISDGGSKVSFKLQKGTYHENGFNGCYPVQIISFVYQLFTFYATESWITDDILSGFIGLLEDDKSDGSPRYSFAEDGSVVFNLQRGPVTNKKSNGCHPLVILKFVIDHYEGFKNPDERTKQIISDLNVAYQRSFAYESSREFLSPMVFDYLEDALLHDLLRSVKRFEGGTWGRGSTKK